MGPKPYNSSNSRRLKKLIYTVAVKQSIITIIFTIINVIIAIISYYLITDLAFSILLTIVLMTVSIPLMAQTANHTKLKPSIDYEGYWLYNLTFEVVVDNHDDYFKDSVNCLCERFHQRKEHGVMHLEKQGLELRVAYAKGNVIGGAQIKWESDPAIFDKNSIRWFFIGEIIWSEENAERMKNLSCELNGFEYYRVDARDEEGRPTHMSGKLLGCNQIMGHFSMKANITYSRISKEKYDLELSKLLHSNSDIL